MKLSRLIKPQLLQGRPFTGAWIETTTTDGSAWGVAVAPSRGRGLKLAAWEIRGADTESPLHGGVY